VTANISKLHRKVSIFKQALQHQKAGGIQAVPMKCYENKATSFNQLFECTVSLIFGEHLY